MARIHHVVKARKDQGVCRKCGVEIKAGDSYRWLANRMGRASIRKTFCASCKIRNVDRSNSKMAQVWDAKEDAQEAIEAAVSDLQAAVEGVEFEGVLSVFVEEPDDEEFKGLKTREALTLAVDSFREAVKAAYAELGQVCRDTADEYQEGLDNMPDGLREAASETEEKIEALNNWSDEHEDKDESDIDLDDLDSAWSAIEELEV